MFRFFLVTLKCWSLIHLKTGGFFGNFDIGSLLISVAKATADLLSSPCKFVQKH